MNNFTNPYATIMVQTSRRKPKDGIIKASPGCLVFSLLMGLLIGLLFMISSFIEDDSTTDTFRVLAFLVGLAFYISTIIIAVITGRSIYNDTIVVTPNQLTAPLLCEGGNGGLWHRVSVPGVGYTVELHLLHPFVAAKNRAPYAYARFRAETDIPEGLPTVVVDGEPAIAINLEDFKDSAEIIEAANVRIRNCSDVPANMQQTASVFPPVGANRGDTIRFRSTALRSIGYAVVIASAILICITFGFDSLSVFLLAISILGCLIPFGIFVERVIHLCKPSSRIYIADGKLTAPMAILPDLDFKLPSEVAMKPTTISLNDLTPFMPYQNELKDVALVSTLRTPMPGGESIVFIDGSYLDDIPRFMMVANSLL